MLVVQKKLFLFLAFMVAAAMLCPSLVSLASSKQMIALTLGLSDERKVSNMPSNIGDDLNYNRNVVKISIAKDLKIIRFEPMAVGTTNFILRDDKGKKIVEYSIVVRKNNLNKVAGEIKSLLGDIEGISIKLVNNKVVIDGEILLPKDMSRIYNVVAQFSDVASSIVTMSPLAQKKISQLIEKDIGNPEIHVRAVNEKFILEGVASNETEKEKAEIIAKTYVPDVVVEAAESAGIVKKRKIDSVINLLSVKPGPEAQPGKIIKLVVHYVELQKDYNKAFRFQWTPSLANDSTNLQFSNGSTTTDPVTGAASTSAGGLISTITGTVNGLIPKLNWAKSHGHARVLKSSSIIVQDGNPGIMNSGSNIPYSVQNNYGQITTQFAETGLKSKVTPKIINAKSDSIDLIIEFSITSLAGLTSKGPLTSKNEIQTRITVRSGQSAAVGGLVGNDSSMAYNRLPAGASDDPIISLLASKQFQQNQSQFVVFITPIIMNSASEGSENIKKKFRLKE
jgi:pilus assembly protein CpaC